MKESLPTLALSHDHSVECRACQRACDLKPGAIGFCSGYANENGHLIDLTYGRATAVQVTELGWAPVSNFSNKKDQILSIGNRGCNFGCSHCINYEHAFARHDTGAATEQELTPEILVEYAKAMGCAGMAANFNEGLLAVAFMKDIFALAKQEGMYTVAVTNGYATPEALDIIAPHLDVYRCDIKAVSPDVMKAQGNHGIDPQGVLNSLLYVRENYPAVHIETVTLLSPGINDSDQELGMIAEWIKTHLGSDTPWHISPMDPVRTHKNPTPPPYVKSTDLIRGNRVVGASFRFTENGVFLTSGNADLIEMSGRDHDYSFLDRAVKIGQNAGLTDVIAKTDGH